MMRVVLVLAVFVALLGPCFGVARAQTRDLAAEPAYPNPVEPDAAPAKPKAKAPAAKPITHDTATPTPPVKPVAEKASPEKPTAQTPAVEVKLAPSIEDELKTNFGWAVVLDPATGIKLGIPGKLAPQARDGKHGTRWSSRLGDVVIETFRIKTSESLSALFEAQKKEPAIRKIESSYSRPDGFFVSGLQGLKQFAVRAQMKDGELRGYTMLYDQAVAGIVLPVLAPMANAFAPFPAGTAPIANLSKPVAYGTGVVVSATGHVLTDRRFAEGCNVITIPGLGNAERQVIDAPHGLALLRVYGKRDLKPAALAADIGAARELTLVGISDPHTQGGGNQRSEIKAQLGDGNAIRLRDPIPVAGLSGAAAIDGHGRMIGIMETRNLQLASAESTLPPVRLVPASAIRDFLAAQNVVSSETEGDARASIVRVICVRH